MIRSPAILVLLVLLCSILSRCKSSPHVDPALREVTPEARGAWGRTLEALTRNDRSEALRHLREVKQKAPLFVKAHLIYQDLMILENERSRLEEEYPDGGTGLALTLRARIAADKDRVRRLEKAVKTAPGLAWAHYALGFEYARMQGQEHLARAQEHLKKAVKIDPDLAEAHVALFHLYMKKIQGSEAAAACERYLELCEKDALRWLKLGIYWHVSGKENRARAAYEKVLALDPETVRAAVRRRDVVLSEEQLRKYEDHGSLWYTARVNLSDILLEEGKYQEVVDLLDKAVAEAPEFPEAHYNLGIALERLGRIEKAHEQWDHYLRSGGKQQERVKAWIKELIHSHPDHFRRRAR